MIVALLLLAPELGVDETIGGGTTVGGESATGSDADGKNEAVALTFATVSEIDSMSNRVGKSPCRNVTPRVVVCVSGIFTAITRPIEVLTSVVIEISVGSAVNVKLTVAFEEEVVRRYSVEALKLKNICGITLPACGIGPLV
jgi:hypothetical protein